MPLAVTQAVTPFNAPPCPFLLQEVVGGQLQEVLRANLHAVAPAVCEEMAGLLAVCPPELQRQVLEVRPTRGVGDRDHF